MMPNRCVVGGCSNATGLHTFPRKEATAELWDHFVRLTRKDWDKHTKHSFICSAHFKEEDFDRNLVREQLGFGRRNTQLKPDSIPSILPSSLIQTPDREAPEPHCTDQELIMTMRINKGRNRCVVGGCTSRTGVTENVSFHLFPKNPVLAEKWKNFVSATRDKWKSFSEHSRICSQHFTEADYYSNPVKESLGFGPSRRTLNPDVVPSIYPPRKKRNCQKKGDAKKKQEGARAKASKGAGKKKSELSQEAKKKRQKRGRKEPTLLVKPNAFNKTPKKKKKKKIKGKVDQHLQGEHCHGHACILLDYLHGLWKDQRLTDVIIQCGDSQFRAHSLVLSAYSRYFRAPLASKHSGNARLDVTSLNVDREQMQVVLTYLYTGRLEGGLEEQTIKDLAVKFQVPALAEEFDVNLTESRSFLKETSAGPRESRSLLKETLTSPTLIPADTLSEPLFMDKGKIITIEPIADTGPGEMATYTSEVTTAASSILGRVKQESSQLIKQLTDPGCVLEMLGSSELQAGDTTALGSAPEIPSRTPGITQTPTTMLGSALEIPRPAMLVPNINQTSGMLPGTSKTVPEIPGTLVPVFPGTSKTVPEIPGTLVPVVLRKLPQAPGNPRPSMLIPNITQTLHVVSGTPGTSQPIPNIPTVSSLVPSQTLQTESPGNANKAARTSKLVRGLTQTSNLDVSLTSDVPEIKQEPDDIYVSQDTRCQVSNNWGSYVDTTSEVVTEDNTTTSAADESEQDEEPHRKRARMDSSVTMVTKEVISRKNGEGVTLHGSVSMVTEGTAASSSLTAPGVSMATTSSSSAVLEVESSSDTNEITPDSDVTGDVHHTKVAADQDNGDSDSDDAYTVTVQLFM